MLSQAVRLRTSLRTFPNYFLSWVVRGQPKPPNPSDHNLEGPMAGLLRNRQADCTVKCGPDHTALGGPVRAARTVVLSYAVLAVSSPLRLLHPIAGPSSDLSLRGVSLCASCKAVVVVGIWEWQPAYNAGSGWVFWRRGPVGVARPVIPLGC